MPAFGERSKQHLAEADPDLQRIANELIQIIDVTVVDARRTMAEQIKNVEKGVSKTLESRHLPNAITGLSDALDMMPYPLAWAAIERGLRAMKEADPAMETARAYIMVGMVAGIAHMLKIKIRQGADWDGDENLAEHSFIDLPHVELVK